MMMMYSSIGADSERVVQAADAHAQTGHGAGGFGGNQRRQRNGRAESDGRQDERQGSRSDDADEDILIRRAEHARRLNQRFIHVDDALIDGHAHDEEAGDGDDDDLRLAADARRDDDQRHVSQRRDIADELNPRLDDAANRLIPRHQDGDRQRDDEAQRIAGNDRGVLWNDISSSLISVVSGYALGFVIALPVAILMAWYKPVRYIIEPWIQFIRNIPPLAYVPLIVIAAGVGRKPQIIVITIACFLIMCVTIYQGVINVDETLIKAARVLGATDKDIFIRVIAPATLPFILTAIRLGASVALTTLIAAESTGAMAGLGMRIRSLNNSFESAPMLLYIIIIGILGITIEKLIKTAEEEADVMAGEARNLTDSTSSASGLTTCARCSIPATAKWSPSTA